VPFTLDEEQKVNGLTLFGQRFQKR
jgi:hypothetical protein